MLGDAVWLMAHEDTYVPLFLPLSQLTDTERTALGARTVLPRAVLAVMRASGIEGVQSLIRDVSDEAAAEALAFAAQVSADRDLALVAIRYLRKLQTEPCGFLGHRFMQRALLYLVDDPLVVDAYRSLPLHTDRVLFPDSSGEVECLRLLAMSEHFMESNSLLWILARRGRAVADILVPRIVGASSARFRHYLLHPILACLVERETFPLVVAALRDRLCTEFEPDRCADRSGVVEVILDQMFPLISEYPDLAAKAAQELDRCLGSLADWIRHDDEMADGTDYPVSKEYTGEDAAFLRRRLGMLGIDDHRWSSWLSSPTDLQSLVASDANLFATFGTWDTWLNRADHVHWALDRHVESGGTETHILSRFLARNGCLPGAVASAALLLVRHHDDLSPASMRALQTFVDLRESGGISPPGRLP